MYMTIFTLQISCCIINFNNFDIFFSFFVNEELAHFHLRKALHGFSGMS